MKSGEAFVEEGTLLPAYESPLLLCSLFDVICGILIHILPLGFCGTLFLEVKIVQ